MRDAQVEGEPKAGQPRVARRIAFTLLAVANLAMALIVLAAAPALADIATPLTGHIIGFGIAAAAALLAKRGTGIVLVGGIAATLLFHVWLGLGWPLRAHSAAPASSGENTLSIISINTWDAADNVDKLRAYLATAPAQVVVLSELGPEKKDLLPTLKATYPFQTSCAHRYDCSIALISQVPFEASGAVPYTKEMPAFVWARFAGMHVIGTHLYRPSRNPGLHARQTEAVAKFIRRIEGPVVLVGDLNTSPWSYSFKSLKAQTGLKSARWLAPSWPAWPVVMPQVALDHILISQDLTFVASHAGPAVGSDHLPVFAQIKRQVQRTRGPGVGGLRLAASGLHLDGEFLADFGSEHGGPRDLRR